jgi:hypothetical protein
VTARRAAGGASWVLADGALGGRDPDAVRPAVGVGAPAHGPGLSGRRHPRGSTSRVMPTMSPVVNPAAR